MIPPDLASSMRPLITEPHSAATKSQTQEVSAPQRIASILSNLAPGQRIMAEVQALLPNGSYRAIVAQREITLALPFSAKAGDTIELEVVEAEGKMSLSFVANRTIGDATDQDKESVPTNLSKTGNFISNLLGGLDEQGGKAKPAALNAHQPIVTTLPEKASDLAPILKDTLLKSGMFYEAHQARWVEGKIPTSILLEEPQGKFSTLRLQNAQPSSSADTPLAHVASNRAPLNDSAQSKSAGDVETHLQSKDVQPDLDLRNTESIKRESTSITSSNLDSTINSNRTGSPVHPELTPLVQQQLNALATQTYVWQGQVWPGQNMDWEITEDDGRPRSGEDDNSGNWQTRLKLNLPNLGGIEARIALGLDGKLSLALKVEQQESQKTLSIAGSDLENSLEASGLKLNKFIVTHGQIAG